MKVVSQGYKSDGSFTILLIPETEAERKEYINRNLSFSHTVNKTMGLLQIHVETF